MLTDGAMLLKDESGRVGVFPKQRSVAGWSGSLERQAQPVINESIGSTMGSFKGKVIADSLL